MQPHFSNPEEQQAFLRSEDSKTLLQKELDVNQAEQTLLRERMRITGSLINDIPSSDPQYSVLVLQLQMDQIELDELKVRESLLIQRLS